MIYFIQMNVLIKSETEMKSFGERLGARLRGGECIELVGDIGAGKTTLTKGIARALGIAEVVQSPTFTINRTYDGHRGLRLNHYDFYRLSDPGIMSEELAESLSESDSVVIIEWGDIVGTILPDDRLRITFASPSETDRTLTLEPFGDKSVMLTGGLK